MEDPMDIEECITLPYKNKVESIIYELLSNYDSSIKFSTRIRKLSREYKLGRIPNNHELLNSIQKYKNTGINPNILHEFEQFCIPKKVRTESGYFVVTVSLPGSIEDAESCEFDCSFCPDLEKQGFRNSKGEIEYMFMPRSYHGNEPSISRAMENGWDPENQVRSRLSTGNSR